MNDIFYLQPLAQVPANPSAPWFKTTPVGKNTLGTMIKRMYNNAGISERFTNHSLCAYRATTLFQAKVPDKLIQQRTGHRSLGGVRRYERTSESQLLDISILCHVVVRYLVAVLCQQLKSKCLLQQRNYHMTVSLTWLCHLLRNLTMLHLY